MFIDRKRLTLGLMVINNPEHHNKLVVKNQAEAVVRNQAAELKTVKHIKAVVSNRQAKY